MTPAMPRSAVGPDPAAGMQLLRQWLSRAAPPDAMAWLDAEIARQ
jgi:hypothetical protein